MKHGNFNGYVCRELASQQMGLSACANALTGMAKKMKKMSNGLTVLAVGSILWAISMKRRYYELLERVEQLEADKESEGGFSVTEEKDD